MKKLVFLTACLASFVIISFSSCELPASFNEDFLIGKWTRPSTLENNDGQDCYRYNADYTGAAWDTGEDVSEAEGQPFTWSVENSTMTHIHIMEMVGKIPKTYTLLTLNDSILSYRDEYGSSFTFIKTK